MGSKTNLNLLIRVEKCESLKPLFIGTYVSIQYVFLCAPVCIFWNGRRERIFFSLSTYSNKTITANIRG